ncbi:MAG: efflux RND transporter periplasmic adaptor subunit [Planctomycetes bacterium]|nr:efflux RND transporter periplasmic adaptor subunit [Planctomycetota bacterium]
MNTPLSLRTVRSTLAVFAALALPLAFAGCGGESKAQEAGGGAAARGPARTVLVRVAPAVERPVAPKVTVVGTIIPRRTSVVASGAEGVVIDFDIEQGQFVEEGTVLSVLLMKSTDLGIAEAEATLAERRAEWESLQETHPEEIREAESRVRAAEILARYAGQKLDRARELFGRNATNQDLLDDALEKSEAASETLSAARTSLARLKASRPIQQAKARHDAQFEQVEFLKAEKAKRTTLAPFDGWVTAERTYVGQWLSKGDPIVTLARLDEVDVVVNVDQRDLGHVQPGGAVTVRVPGVEPREWTGNVSMIVPRSDWEQGSRGFPVKVRLKNEFRSMGDERLPVLNEGMMAEVTFTGAPVSAVLVHKDALVRSTHGMSVYIFQPDDRAAAFSPEKGLAGKALHVPMEPGISDGNYIQVLPLVDASQSEHKLTGGTFVVTEGGENLKPPVQPGVEALLKE